MDLRVNMSCYRRVLLRRLVSLKISEFLKICYFSTSIDCRKQNLKVGEQVLFLRQSEKCNFLTFNINTKENVILCLFLQLKLLRFFCNFPQLILMVYEEN